MKKIITSAVLCAAMATAVSTFGVQPVSATYPLIDKNGNTVPVERDVDNQKIMMIIKNSLIVIVGMIKLMIMI